MLALKDLKAMKPGTPFADGTTMIPHPWKDGERVTVRWVAQRGGIHDWAIYHSFDGNIIEYFGFGDDSQSIAPLEIILSHGAKLHDMEKVKELVPCDKKAEEMYRH